MSIASDLLEQHVQTLVDDNVRWQTLLADDVLWELAYGAVPWPSGEAVREDGSRAARHVVRGAVENIRFFDLNVYPFADGCIGIKTDKTIVAGMNRDCRHHLHS